MVNVRGAFRTVLWALVAGISVVTLQAAELHKDFRLEPVLTGLTNPSALASLPGGRLLIGERTTGKVRIVQWGELQTNPVCTVAVNSTNEGGLLGIAVHPAFSDNHWVYLYYTDAASGKNKVQRFTIDGKTCTNGLDILANLGAGASFKRNGGGIAFGPDGKLYVATGDVEASSNGQNAATLMGKVLRVNDNGSIPGDNPTPGSAVYTRGLRNGSGLVVGSTGKVYVTDAGDTVASVYDELNVAKSNGNLGWDLESGPGGVKDQPLQSWLPTVGIAGTAVYGMGLFPDLNADGKDNDHDKWGNDRYPGVFKTDDNGIGICIGSVQNGNTCVADAGCTPTRVAETVHYCEKRDDPAEYCPGGIPSGDDACGNTGVQGVDELDESFLNNVFAAGGNAILRAVLKTPGLDTLHQWEKFLDSTYLTDCPTGWTALAAGTDGLLYATATNGGGANGKLYRVVYDDTPGPREVSRPGTYFPLRVDKQTLPDRVAVVFEDLREDSMQPQNSGALPVAWKREYTIWRGNLGSWYSHTAQVVGQGAEINQALRKQLVTIDPTKNYYFLVSGRSADLEGTLGNGTPGPRPGYAVTDLCQTIGYHQSPSWSLFTCGKDFTLQDPHGQTRSLYEMRGKVVLLDFSAIWCGPCQAEADIIENLYQDYKDRGVEFISVLMDEESNGFNWNGRPANPEARLWEDRTGTNPDHTFDTWNDPIACTPSGTPPNPQGICNNSLPQFLQAWPKYDAHSALPTNAILDQGLRVAYTQAGYDEATIRIRLDTLLGATDQCLH
jgi:thiol-disulfide isomerase/thioredoxin